MEVDSNHRSKYAADLQSVPFGHSGIHPYENISRNIRGTGIYLFKPMIGLEPITC